MADASGAFAGGARFFPVVSLMSKTGMLWRGALRGASSNHADDSASDDVSLLLGS